MESKFISLTSDGPFVCTIGIPEAFKVLPKENLISLFALIHRNPDLNEEAGWKILDVLLDWKDEEQNKENPDKEVLRRISHVEKWLKEAAKKKYWKLWDNRGWW